MIGVLKTLSFLSLMLFIGSHQTEAKTIKYEKVQLDIAQTGIPFEELLDIGIMLFDPNVPEKENPMIFPEIRKAEARYMPYHLTKTLESTGHWGGVWVLPERSKAIDLIVVGRIEKSDGLVSHAPQRDPALRSTPPMHRRCSSTGRARKRVAVAMRPPCSIDTRPERTHS